MTDAAKEAWPDASGYLLNHSAGLPPTSTADALREQLFGPWHAHDDQVWPHWLEAITRFRHELAEVMHTQTELVCPQPTVSAALTQILGALPVTPKRNRLLIAERAFPSLGFVFSQLERRGFEVVMVPRTLSTLDPKSWKPYLDERTHCVLFTHVHSNTGECHDMPALCSLAREAGAISVVDVAQSIGIRPVNAPSWNADFIIGSCIKWLCGGSGAGFLWVNPQRMDECEPIDVGWFSHADPFEFDINHFAYAPDALRFWGGTPNVAPAIVAGHSIAALRAVGLEKIEARNRALGDLLCRSVPAAALQSPLDPAQRGGSVILHFGENQAGFIDRLKKAGLQFDARDEGVRLSPHFYNSEADMQRVLNCV
jgi:selenocysteine lyase/cysteine desulfurase